MTRGSLTMWSTRLLIAAVATSLLLPAEAFAEPPAAKKVQRTKITAHPKRPRHGYGFLPGYRQPPDLTDWRRQGEGKQRYEQRYWRYGQVLYGWGRPGFYRGRWTGGSFGPCWTSTPIGMMWTCGQ